MKFCKVVIASEAKQSDLRFLRFARCDPSGPNVFGILSLTMKDNRRR